LPDPDSKQQRLADLTNQIEVEMRAAGLWSADPPTADEVLAAGSFGGDSIHFETWLQVVYLGSLRTAEADVSASSMRAVAIRAAREWDGVPDRKPLLRLLIELPQATSA
jgi:uncharacterized protein YqcC (DUF446 family)